MATTAAFKNINMLTKAQYDGVSSPATDELYAISGSGFGMPSTRYQELSLGASGATYTMPGNGWIVFRRTSTAAGQYIQLSNHTRSTLQIFIQSGTSSGVVGCYIPVQKGDNVGVAYNLGSTTNQLFRFVYAEGE